MEIDPVVVLADELRATEAALRAAMRRYEKSHKRENGSAVDSLLESVDARKGIVNGELRIGIIPTLAPYLLPLFISSFTKKFPEVKLTVSELTTQLLVSYLREGRIDVGMLVTPLQEPGISEDVLFYEELVAEFFPGKIRW